MADIKLTLSKDTRRRAPNIESEARRLKDEGVLYYELHTKPLRASTGSWVYFIRGGKLVARARVGSIRWMSSGELGRSYTGELSSHDGWRVEVKAPMQIAAVAIRHESFQGFRYVRPDEEAAFKRVFRKKN